MLGRVKISHIVISSLFPRIDLINLYYSNDDEAMVYQISMTLGAGVLVLGRGKNKSHNQKAYGQ